MLISLSDEHDPKGEAAAILFQIFVHIARMYVHAKSSKDAAWEKDLRKFIPPFVDYTQHMLKARGEAGTRTMLEIMYEDAAGVFLTGVKSAFLSGQFVTMKKSADLQTLLDNTKIVQELKDYGEKFIDHVISGKDSNVDSMVADLVKLSDKHRGK